MNERLGTVDQGGAASLSQATAPWTGSVDWREHAMLLASLAVIAWLLPWRISLLLAATTAVVGLIGTLQARRTVRIALAILAIVAHVAAYQAIGAVFLPQIVWAGAGLEIFFVLRCYDWIVSKPPRDMSARPGDRITRLLLYLFFLPTLFAGPIPTYSEFYRLYRPPAGAWARRVLENLPRIVWGAIRFFLIARFLREVALRLKVAGLAGDFVYGIEPRLLLWGYVVLFLVFTYTQFSGFCDMGIGVARILGFRLADNFDKALLSSSPLRYWKTMNISVYRFLMTHVFFPCWRHDRIATKIVTTFLVSGAWHVVVAPVVTRDVLIQVPLATGVYGLAVAATFRLGGTRLGGLVERLRGTRAGALVWTVQWALTLLFTALVHQVFWGGMTSKPLHDNVELFRRLFLPGG